MEFDISKHVLDIVYSQTICWFAIFFSPLISALTMVKIFAVFYLRLFFVKYVSTHQRKMVTTIMYIYILSPQISYGIYMYVYKFQCCTPAKIPYSASRASSVFKVVLFLAFSTATLLVVSYIGIGSSKGCGPFREFHVILCYYNIKINRRKIIIFYLYINMIAIIIGFVLFSVISTSQNQKLKENLGQMIVVHMTTLIT